MLALALVLLAAWFPYRHASECDFAYDDVVIIQENPRVQGLDQLGEILTTEYWNSDVVESRLYRPITLLTFAIEAELWGLKPSHLHLSNVLLHGIVSLLVATLAWVLLARWRRPPAIRARRATALPPLAASVATGILFAVHPLHSEAVAGLVGRAEILSALFSVSVILTILLGGRWLWGASPLILLALLSKESSALVIPLVILAHLFGLAPAAASRDESEFTSASKVLARRSRALGRTLLFLLPGLLVAIMMRIAVLHEVPAPPLYFTDNPMIALSVGDRIATAGTIFLRYLGLHLFPHRLSPDYSYHAVPLGREAPFETAIGLLLLATLTIGCAVLLIRSNRVADPNGPSDSNAFMDLIGFAVAWYVGGVLAIGNFFILISTFMAERLTYLPGIGFFLVIGVLIHQVLDSAERKSEGTHLGSRRLRWVAPGSIAFVVVLTTLFAIPKCAERTRAWTNNETLFTQAALDQPQSHRVWAELGGVHSRQGRLEEAVDALLKSRAIFSGFYKTHERLLSIYLDTGNLDSARVAAADLRALDPRNIMGYYAFARFHQADGHLASALEELHHGMRADSTYLPFYLVTGEVYEAQGRVQDAIEAYLRVLDAEPNLTSLKVRVGPLLVASEQWGKATPVYRDLCKADPSWSNLNYLSWCLLHLDIDSDTEDPDMDEEARPPGSVITPALQEAIDLAKRSIEVAPVEMRPYPMDTYAQALWRAGRSSESIAVLEDLHRTRPDNAEYANRLRVYRSMLGSKGR